MTVFDLTSGVVEVVSGWCTGATDTLECVDRVEEWLNDHYELTNGGEYFTVGNRNEDGSYNVYEDDLSTDNRVLRFRVVMQ